MFDRQSIALENPCALAKDTLNPIFHATICVNGQFLSTILTVNK